MTPQLAPRAPITRRPLALAALLLAPALALLQACAVAPAPADAAAQPNQWSGRLGLLVVAQQLGFGQQLQSRVVRSLLRRRADGAPCLVEAALARQHLGPARLHGQCLFGRHDLSQQPLGAGVILPPLGLSLIHISEPTRPY